MDQPKRRISKLRRIDAGESVDVSTGVIVYDVDDSKEDSERGPRGHDLRGHDRGHDRGNDFRGNDFRGNDFRGNDFRDSMALEGEVIEASAKRHAHVDPKAVNDQLPAAPSSHIEELYSSAQAFAERAKSPQTKRAYQSDWADFSGWCQLHRLYPLPASPETIALYLTERAETLKISSLRRRLTAIRQIHQMKGIEFNAKHAAIRNVWSGIRRAKGTAAVGKAPVRVVDLKMIILTRPDSLKGIRDIALISLGFSGAFRRSELVGLNVRDLDFVPEGLKVTVRKSKTDQEGEGMIKSIPYGRHERTCCVRAVKRWLQASHIESGPIFRPLNRHGQVRPRRLSGHAVAIVLKHSLAESLRVQGLPEAMIQERITQFSGHSLRAGYVTSAAAEGAAEHAIMKQTGHKRVDTLRRYIREGDLFHEHPLGKMDL